MNMKHLNHRLSTNPIHCDEDRYKNGSHNTTVKCPDFSSSVILSKKDSKSYDIRQGLQKTKYPP